jgi:hypothetical protein
LLALAVAGGILVGVRLQPALERSVAARATPAEHRTAVIPAADVL